LGAKIKLERAMEKFASETLELEGLEKEREVVMKELDAAEQGDAVNKYELAELEHTHGELVNQKGDLQAQNEAAVLPALGALEKELEATLGEFKRQGEALERETKAKAALLERSDALEAEVAAARVELAHAEEARAKAQAEPERVQRQAESVLAAAEALQAAIAALAANVGGAQEALEKQALRRGEAEQERYALQKKLQAQTAAIEKRRAEVEQLQNVLDDEKGKQHELTTLKLEVELAKRAAREELHRANEELSLAKKDYDAKKRLLRKKRYVADGVKEVLPALQAQLLDQEHSLRSFAVENKRVALEVEEARCGVEVLVARFVKQETLEKSKQEELGAAMKAVAAAESELAQWQAEERKQGKLVALLAAQRELKARAATQAGDDETEARQNLKVKELQVLDLTKKCNQVNNRLKESASLYDLVKSERNKYLNLIQASTQALAEMQEKVKVLGAEVEILRGESIAKDKALGAEVGGHAMSKAARDALRLELNKGQQEYRRKQAAVQAQIEAVKALNGVLNGHEREMLRLKKAYEAAVAGRNECGVRLIDRNDELCVLYEKANLQTATLEQGDQGVKAREEELRGLRLELHELERKVLVARKKRPAGGDLAAEARRLEADLAAQRKRTAALCVALESPENEARFRVLGGEDPSAEALAAKVATLEARLDEKKGALLERELVLEEVTTLTQKLKNRAGEGREGTLKLTAQVNLYQTKIRDVTRRMMATVSELSMYQATAMKLQQEKNARAAALEEAKWKVAHGQPPSEAAEREWYHAEQQALSKAEARLMSRTAGANGGGAAAAAVRTTAEPRPNAYIPDELGIPKPYGTLAPFKPTEAGATMRHIRNPNPAEIEI
jgi:hypothetical protein